MDFVDEQMRPAGLHEPGCSIDERVLRKIARICRTIQNVAISFLEVLPDILLHQGRLSDTLRALDSDKPGVPVYVVHQPPGELHGDLGYIRIMQGEKLVHLSDCILWNTNIVKNCIPQKTSL